MSDLALDVRLSEGSGASADASASQDRDGSPDGGEHDVDVVLAHVRELRDGSAAAPADGVLIAYAARASEDREAERAFDLGAEAFVTAEQYGSLERVVQAHLRRLASQRHVVERQRVAFLENRALRETAATRATLFEQRETPQRPDGVLEIDGDLVVRAADHGATSLLGSKVLGANVERLIPGLDLAPRLHSIRHASREGLRCDRPGRDGGPGRSLMVSVHPLRETPEPRWLLFLNDARRRPLGREVALAPRFGLSAPALPALLDAAAEYYRFDRLPLPPSGAERWIRQLTELTGSRVPFLVQGPSGAARRRTARAVHYAEFPTAPLLEVCCRLSPRGLERELFGESPGNTGGQEGALQAAKAGTLLLCDLQAMPPGVQERLCSWLESNPEAPRLVATCDATLDACASDGGFSLELLRKLDGTRVLLPSLSEVPEDIVPLAVACAKDLGAKGLSPEAAEAVARYPWPGNAEELSHAIEQAVRGAGSGWVEIEHLPRSVRAARSGVPRMWEAQERGRRDGRG